MLHATLLCATIAAASAGAIELNKGNFDDHVKKSGKNAFVKFLAPWWGHCKSMKPAWDQLGSEYADSSSVVVADVDCTVEQDLCSQYDVKGYPTIKYFGPDSPEKGSDYNGGRDFEGLKKFVEDELEVKCLVSDPSGCTDKEKEFMGKWQAKPKADVAAQLERLEKMMGSKMTPDLKKWLVQRINVLKQLKDA